MKSSRLPKLTGREVLGYALRRKIQRLLEIDDCSGIMIRASLLGGLSRGELLLLHHGAICDSAPFTCFCSRIHLTVENDFVFITHPPWFDFENQSLVLPRILWKSLRTREFLDDCDIAFAEAVTWRLGVRFDDLAEIHDLVTSQLRARCNGGVRASICPTAKIRDTLNAYRDAWETFDVQIT